MNISNGVLVNVMKIGQENLILNYLCCQIWVELSYIMFWSRWVNLVFKGDLWGFVKFMLPYLAPDISSLYKVLIFRYRKHKIKRTWQYTHPQERVRGHFVQTLMRAQTCAHKLLEDTLIKNLIKNIQQTWLLSFTYCVE